MHRRTCRNSMYRPVFGNGPLWYIEVYLYCQGDRTGTLAEVYALCTIQVWLNKPDLLEARFHSTLDNKSGTNPTRQGYECLHDPGSLWTGNICGHQRGQFIEIHRVLRFRQTGLRHTESVYKQFLSQRGVSVNLNSLYLTNSIVATQGTLCKPLENREPLENNHFSSKDSFH